MLAGGGAHLHDLEGQAGLTGIGGPYSIRPAVRLREIQVSSACAPITLWWGEEAVLDETSAERIASRPLGSRDILGDARR